MNIRTSLSERVQSAMLAAGIPEGYNPHVTPSKKPGFGDYQANGAMGAAKAMKRNPREIAQSIVDNLQLEGIASKIEIAGPGFINIHLDQQWLAQQLQSASQDERLGIEKKSAPLTVVADYSSPNLAKEMHIGHIRSTCIGDAIVRILEFTGDTLIRQNHVGDWGTQFGMLIAELEEHMQDGEHAEFALKDLETFYKQSKKHFDEDEDFKKRARDYVVKLQSGDADVLALWEKFKNVSLSHNQDIYQKLNVSLTAEDACGESFYNDDLAVLVKELKDKGLSVESDGAQVVFLQELADKNGDPSPVIVQKADGGYLYATTDLAAMRYRCHTLKADRLMYFIDDRQSLHMKQVFLTAQKANFVPPHVLLEHHPFGKILGQDGKPYKTREGNAVKLSDVINEAIERASEIVRKRERKEGDELSEDQIISIGEKVGIGAIKYADLSKTRTNDYIFDWDAMLSFEGNTGPYLQYAYTRVASIFRNAGESLDTFTGEIVVEEEKEKELAIKLLQFAEIIEQVSEDAFPHVLCTYLYDLASLFMSFYEACPILKADSAELRASRLQISKAVAKTMTLGLDLLGIDVMEKM
ncbi:Arginine--tRNA ligase [Thalassocella blandensis]|nr:Arginine--tRNA ligase [Thalassocella blandensis]